MEQYVPATEGPGDSLGRRRVRLGLDDKAAPRGLRHCLPEHHDHTGARRAATLLMWLIVEQPHSFGGAWRTEMLGRREL